MTDNQPKYLKYVWKDAAARLRKVGIKTSLLDSRMLLQEVLGITYEELLVSATRIISDEEILRFEKYLSRRILREPISKILQVKPFWKYDFKTTAATLDPRPDSETMIDAVLDEYKDHERALKILDLGTGTGCLAITLLKEYNHATATGIDASIEALQVAGENAQNLKVDKRINLIKGNWHHGLNERFDIIISNPPYIKTEAINYLAEEVRLYDPAKALDGGADGLDAYREILDGIEHVMSNHAHVFFEIGKWQENDVSNLIKTKGFNIHNIRNDLLGIPRVICFSKPYLKIVKN